MNTSRREVSLYLARLTPEEKEEIIRRRGCRSNGDGKVHRISNLEIHHKDRNPNPPDWATLETTPSDLLRSGRSAPRPNKTEDYRLNASAQNSPFAERLNILAKCCVVIHI